MANAADAGSAAGAAIEGFLGGVEAGGQLRDRRTARAFAVEDRLREQIAAQLTADRQRVFDEQSAAAEAREAAEFEIEHGLVPDTGGAAPEAPTGVAPPGLPGLPQGVMDLRADVAREIAPQAPVGFRRVGPSQDQIAEEDAIDLRRRVGEFMADPDAFDISDPRNVEALEGSDLLDDLPRQREAASRPDNVSPLQRVTGEGGREFTFDPRGEVGNRIAPLMFEGEQFVSRTPTDNFARSNAQSAANAISRLDPFDFAEGEIENEREQTAQRFGFASVAEVQRVLSEAVGGGAAEEAVDVEARASELKAQGLSDDEVIERLRAEGLISG